MNKKTLYSVVIGALLCLVTYFVLANSHIEIFQASATKKVDYNPDVCDRYGKPSDMIALMQLDREYDSCWDFHLTGAGWAVAVLVIGVIPMAMGSFVAGKVVKS